MIEDIKDMTPNHDTIKHLEAILEDAKKGKIRSYVAVCAWDDDSVSDSWVLDARNSKRRMLSQIVLCQSDLADHIKLTEGGTSLSNALENIWEI